MSYPCYKLTLHKTYYEKGFFNLGVDVERFVSKENGPLKILLGDSKTTIQGRVDRNSNMNNTPRVFGGIELEKWIKHHCELKEVVNIFIKSSNEIWLKKLGD